MPARLAETEARRGNAAAAEAAYREALTIDGRDFYLLAAYADFLLDQDRAADVLHLLAGREPSTCCCCGWRWRLGACRTRRPRNTGANWRRASTPRGAWARHCTRRKKSLRARRAGRRTARAGLGAQQSHGATRARRRARAARSRARRA
ncbi:MAG: hypothetical protein U1F25_10695 [Rubrivivax sp.]